MLALRDPFSVFDNLFFGGRTFDDFTQPKVNSKKVSYVERLTDDGYEISLDLPGVDPEKVDAHANNGYIIVAAKREDTGDDVGLTRYVGNLYDFESAQASIRYGVLTIRLKQVDPKRSGKISSIKIER